MWFVSFLVQSLMKTFDKLPCREWQEYYFYMSSIYLSCQQYSAGIFSFTKKKKNTQTTKRIKFIYIYAHMKIIIYYCKYTPTLFFCE